MATIIVAQQLFLFPGTFLPPATVRPCLGIECYTDLTPTQAHDLIIRPRSATAALAAFRRAGWMNEDRTLTETGVDVQRRARAILAGTRLPASVLHVSSNVRFRIRHADQWRAVHLKCLLYLTRSPEAAWRYLTDIFSVPAVEALQDTGLVIGDRRRGAPQCITEAGLAVLRESLDRAGVTYSKPSKGEK